MLITADMDQKTHKKTERIQRVSGHLGERAILSTFQIDARKVRGVCSKIIAFFRSLVTL